MCECSDEGWRSSPACSMLRALRFPQSAAVLMNLDPNTHAFVMATAAVTSICFMISALNVLAVILSHVL